MKRVLHVLIVEDEPVIALLLRDVVESMGHLICKVVATEAAAVEIALSCQPDLMIVDAGLRDGSGVGAMQSILKLQPMPHIFVTGDKRGVQQSAPEATILEKPFFVPDLERAIENAMASRVAS